MKSESNGKMSEMERVGEREALLKKKLESKTVV